MGVDGGPVGASGETSSASTDAGVVKPDRVAARVVRTTRAPESSSMKRSRSGG